MTGEEAIEFVKEAFIAWESEYRVPHEDWTETHKARDMAIEALSADVVRCKDCKYWVPDQVGVVEQPYCTRLGYEELTGLDLRIGSADHFCCFGERREE